MAEATTTSDAVQLLLKSVQKLWRTEPPLPAGDNAVVCLANKDKTVRVEVYQFPEGRPKHVHDEIEKRLTASNIANICKSAMLVYHESGLAEADRVLCTTEKRDATYFMLCDDEELEHNAFGLPDGDIKIRGKCGSWRLEVAWSADCGPPDITGRGTPAAVIGYSGINQGYMGDIVGRVYLCTLKNGKHELTEIGDYSDETTFEPRLLELIDMITGI
jgi:hypothetical protein